MKTLEAEREIKEEVVEKKKATLPTLEVEREIKEETTEEKEVALPDPIQFPKISKALVASYMELQNPINKKSNEHFDYKYAPLSEVLNTVRPILAKNGLAFMQIPMTNNRQVAIQTVLIHESGEQWQLPPFTVISDKATPQGIGSALTYARRYALSAILGIASEDDDDGNEAEGGDPVAKNQRYKKLMSEAALLGQQLFKKGKEKELGNIVDTVFGKGNKLTDASIDDLDKIEKAVELMKNAMK